VAYVQVITTGGTIASLPNEKGDVSASLSGDALVEKLGVEGNIKVTSSVTTGSYNFDYSTLFQVAQDVIEALENPEVTGVVLTHGTDTMEETAFYLSLVTSSYQKPVVLTGAQLDASYAFSDGTKNLQDAIYAAQSEKLSTFGALIVFAGFIYSARDVSKIDTNALEAFGASGWGPIGRVDNKKIIASRYMNPAINLEAVIPKPVALVRLGIGMNGTEFEQITDGYPGVVIEAFGRGNAHRSITPEVNRLVDAGIPVMITSRCARGEVLPYYGNGGGKDLVRAGAWFAGDLSGEKARILLGTMLSSGKSWGDMKQMVHEVGHA